MGGGRGGPGIAAVLEAVWQGVVELGHGAVQAVQRDVALRLEDARVELARRLERETVEARLQIEIEKAAREARWRPPAA